MKDGAKNLHSNKNSSNDKKITRPQKNPKRKLKCFVTAAIKAQITKKEENTINSILKIIL